jgi:hypothetical protein
MAAFTAQNADAVRVVAKWISDNVQGLHNVWSEYVHEMELPYVVVMPGQRGDLDSQNEIHGRSPSFRIETYSDSDTDCSAIQEEIYQLFRHAKNVTKTATDSEGDTHTITFTSVSSFGGNQEPFRGDFGYWVQDYYTFYFVEE